jgi:hypothetical protein
MLILLPMHASATIFKAERAQRCLPIRRLNISPQTNCNALACVHVNINGNQMQRRETPRSRIHFGCRSGTSLSAWNNIDTHTLTYCWRKKENQFWISIRAHQPEKPEAKSIRVGCIRHFCSSACLQFLYFIYFSTPALSLRRFVCVH